MLKLLLCHQFKDAKFFNEDKPRMINKETTTRNSKQNVHVFRIYTLSDLGVSSNLFGMLGTEWGGGRNGPKKVGRREK